MRLLGKRKMNSNTRFWILLLCSLVGSTKIALAQKADVRGVTTGMTIEQAEQALNGRCTETRYDYRCSSPKLDAREQLRVRITSFLMPPKIYSIQFSFASPDDPQAVVQDISFTYNGPLQLPSSCKNQWKASESWTRNTRIAIRLFCGPEGRPDGTLKFVLELTDHSIALADADARIEFERRTSKFNR